MVDKPLQVGGLQDIYSRGVGEHQRPPPEVILARGDKVCDDAVVVGRTDDFSYRDAHALGVQSRHGVAKVAGRDANINGLPERDNTVPAQIQIA